MHGGGDASAAAAAEVRDLVHHHIFNAEGMCRKPCMDGSDIAQQQWHPIQVVKEGVCKWHVDAGCAAECTESCREAALMVRSQAGCHTEAPSRALQRMCAHPTKMLYRCMAMLCCCCPIKGRPRCNRHARRQQHLHVEEVTQHKDRARSQIPAQQMWQCRLSGESNVELSKCQ